MYNNIFRKTKVKPWNATMTFKLIFLYINLLALATTTTSAHNFHPNPTYFQRFDKHGNILDRLSSEYSRIENKARLNHISRNDAETIKLETHPRIVENGGNITLSWHGVDDPDTEDYIAYYCPYNDDVSKYIDYFYVGEVPGWQNGGTSCNLTLHNMRSSCAFKYYRNTESRYVLSAISNTIEFHNGGPYAPTQGHISMTNKPTEMRVMWVSANITQAVVRYGTTREMLLAETRYQAHTYAKDAMCQFPATSEFLFRDPGYIYNVLLTNLKPDTLYYYSYGNGRFMSPPANFTTPLPKGDHTPFKFIVYGDMGIHFWPGQAKLTAQNVRREVAENDIKFVFHHGDISYARGIAYLWEVWFKLTEPYATLVPYMVGIGNHEYDHTRGGIGHDPSNITSDDGWRPEWFNGGIDSGGECAVPMFHRYHMPDNGNSLFWYRYECFCIVIISLFLSVCVSGEGRGWCLGLDNHKQICPIIRWIKSS